MGLFANRFLLLITAAVLLVFLSIPIVLNPVVQHSVQVRPEDQSVVWRNQVRLWQKVQQRTTEEGKAFAHISLLSPREKAVLRRFRNADHVARAQRLGVPTVRTRDDADRFVQGGRLMPLETNDYYYVRRMNYSIPYVTPSTYRLLERIGEQFHSDLQSQGLPLYRFVISSALRSSSDQARLRRVNRNAARTRSSHEFGTTVDILYSQFRPGPVAIDLPLHLKPFRGLALRQMEEQYAALGNQHHARLKAILGRILISLQQEGDALVIIERLQPVFHVTVGRDQPSIVMTGVE